MRSTPVSFYSEGQPLPALWRTPDDGERAAAGDRPGPGLARPQGRQALRPLPRGAHRRRLRRPGLRLPRLRRLRGRPRTALARAAAAGPGQRGHLPDDARRRRRRRHRRLRHRRHRRRQRRAARRRRPAGQGRREPGPGRRRRGLAAPDAVGVTSGWRSSPRSTPTGKLRVLTGAGRLVHPREEIMVPTPERRDDDGQGRRRRPHPDARSRWPPPRRSSPTGRSTPAPRLTHAADGDRRRGRRDDADRSRRRAVRGGRAARKQLIMQRHTTHYAAYDRTGSRSRRGSSSGSTEHVRTGGRRRHARDGRAHERADRDHGGASMSSRSADRRRHASSRRPGRSTADVLVDGRPDRRARRARGGVVGRRRATDRRHRQARAARHGRRPRAHPRAGLHAQGGHHHHDAQAAAGGVTTIFGMPNLDPPTTTPQLLDEVLRAATRAKSIVDYNHNPAADRQPTRSRAMAERGIRAFKIYMVVDTGRTYPHPAGTGMHDHGDLLRMMDTIAATGLRVHHPPARPGADGLHRGRVPGPRREHAAGLRAGLRRPRRRHLGHRHRRGAAAGRGLRLPGAHRAHADRAARSTRSAGPRRAGVDVTCEVNHWAPFLVDVGGRRAARPVRAVLLGARRGPRGGLGGHARRHDRHARPPTTRRTRARRRRSAGRRCGAAHTGTPGIQYYYPLLLDAVRPGRAHPRARRRAGRRRVPAAGLRPRPATRARSRSGSTRTSSIADLDAPWTITNDGVLSQMRLDAVRRPRRSARASSARSCAAADVYADGEVVGEPGHGRLAPSASRRHARPPSQQQRSHA